MPLQSQRRLVALDIVRQSQRQQALGQRGREHNALVEQRGIENQRADRTLAQSGRRLDYNIGRQDRQDEIAAEDRKLKHADYSANWIADRVRGMDALKGDIVGQQNYADQAFKRAAELGIDVGDWTADRFLNPDERASLLKQVETAQARAARMAHERNPPTANIIDPRTGEPVIVPTPQSLYQKPAYKPPSSGVNVYTGDVPKGNVPPQKPVIRKLQDELIALENAAGRVNEISNLFNPDFLTYQGTFTAWLASVKDKANIDLDQEEIDFLGARKEFAILVEQEFNAYRKLITGAAASVQELESLKKATVNMDQSPEEFKETLKIYQAELLRTIRLKRRVLREGIQVGDPLFGDYFDRLFETRQDDDKEARAAELLAQGLSQNAVLKKLDAEGYEEKQR